MAIEKRTLPGGITVGFDTETNHYCNLPKEAVRETPAASDDEKKPVGRPRKEQEESGS